MPASFEIYFVAGAIAIAIATVALIIRIARKKHPYRGESVLLVIKVSQTNERGPLAAEQMFASLHGILRHTGYFSEVSARQEYISFEIASVGQKIHFYAWVPKHLQQFVEGQIYAQYPDIEIFTADKDYAASLKGTEIVAATELEFNTHDVLPIKEFEELEETIKKETLDSLAGITEAMGKLSHPTEQVWLQVICKPIEDRWWHKLSYATVNAYKKGRKPLRFDKKYNFIVVNPFARAFLLPFKLFLLPLYLVQLITSVNDEGESKAGGKAGHVDAENDAICESIMTKATKLGYRVVIRMVYASTTKESFTAAQQKLRGVAGAFKQFNTVHLNGFKMKPIKASLSKELVRQYQQRVFSERGMLMNVRELATVMHLPNILVKTPTIAWVTSRKIEPPNELPTPDNTPPNELTILGETNFRGFQRSFGIRDADRRRHVYIIGKTGMGKSTLLENMIKADIEAGKGVGVIDPHGDLAEAVLRFIPSWRSNDVIVFDPSDYDYPVALNLIESVRPQDRSKIASGFVGIFKKMFGNSWGPRLEHILRNTILALLEYPNSSILGVMRILVDADYRERVVSKVTDPSVRSFWLDEFAGIQPKNLAEVISPIQNKVGQFLSSPAVRNIIGQSRSTINIREAMDTKKILVVNLSKGKLGDDMSKLLGSMLVTKFQIDAMSRAEIPEKERVDFNLYVDEFQNFATDSFEEILSEARKYRLSLTIANQYIHQLEKDQDEGVKHAVFGNVGTIITFSTGAEDAEFLAKQFGFEEEEEPYIVGLDKFTVYLRLLIDNMPTRTFSATTFPPPRLTNVEEAERQRTNIVMLSRERYAHPREEIEEKISKWIESERREAPGVHKKEKKGSAVSHTEAPRPVPVPEIDVNTVTAGEMIEGSITGVTNYGLFVEYRGVQGLVHSSELPDKKMLKERYDVFHKGDMLNMVLIGVKDGRMILTIIPEHVASVTSDTAIQHTMQQQCSQLVSRFEQHSAAA